jgi:repressor LexA
MTEIQAAILDFIGAYQEEHGVPPSVRAIQRHLRYASPTSVQRPLTVLAADGHLDQLPNGSWGLKSRQAQLHFRLPVYGDIPAGLPAMREQEPDETIAVDPAAFGVRAGRPGDFWGLRVRGDSMIGASILDGDIALLTRRPPKAGDIIAALVDDTSSTLKRLVKVRGRWVLRAENPRYPDLVPERLEAQGVLVGVIRRKIA